MTVTAWAGGVSGWTPFYLGAALLGYWDARSGYSIENGVASWVDRTAGYALTQPTAARQPAFSATGLNGDAAVVFDGTDDFLNMESVPFPVGAAGCEMWAVADNQGPVGQGKVILQYGGTSGPDSRRLSLNNMSSVLVRGGDGTTNVDALGSGVVTGRHVYRGSINASTVRAHIDGELIGSASGAINTAAVRTRIGALTGGTPSNFWQGAISIGLITAPLSDAQAASLNAFLAARRGALS